MLISRKEQIAAAVVLSTLGIGGWVWTHQRLRAEVVRPGPAQLDSVEVLRKGGQPRAGFENGVSYGSPGDVVLYAGLPSTAKGLVGGSPFGPMDRPAVTARLIVPGGGEAPLGVSMGSNSASAAIALPLENPAGVDHVEVELDVPGSTPTRWRVENLPATKSAFDPRKLHTKSGSGASAIHGRAYWSRSEKSGRSFVLVGVSAPGFIPTADEACFIDASILPAYASPSNPTGSWGGMGKAIEAGNVGLGFAHSYAYAPHAKAVRVTGKLTRRRIFDEWADFGTVPLQPRTKPMASMQHLGEAQIDLSKPRTAVTASGLRLTIAPLEPYQNMSYSFGPQTLVMRMNADPATLTKGLPSSFATGGAKVQVGVDQKLAKGAIFHDLSSKQPIVWGLDVKKPVRALPLRVRVRRSEVLETVPFDLRLPIDPKPQKVPIALSEHGDMSFVPDPQTLLPVPTKPPAQ